MLTPLDRPLRKLRKVVARNAANAKYKNAVAAWASWQRPLVSFAPLVMWLVVV
jgi:hypothetical protein